MLKLTVKDYKKIKSQKGHGKPVVFFLDRHRVTEPSPISPSAVAARLRERQKWEFKAQCLSVAAWLGGPRLSQHLDSRNVMLFQVVYVCFFFHVCLIVAILRNHRNP